MVRVGPMPTRRLILLCAAMAVACHSKDITNGEPAPTDSASGGTNIVVYEALDAAPPDCTVHLVSERFDASRANPTGTVRIEGDYTRTLAKVEVRRGGAAGRPSEVAWSGTFKGPRDALFQTLQRHVCTAARVYALEPSGNKDPTKGAVTLQVYEMKPDEKRDVESLCNMVTRAAGADASTPELREHAEMTWAEDVITTTKWDAWRRVFAHDRASIAAQSGDPRPLFKARAGELESAARALGLPCPTASDWKKQ